MSKRIRTLEDMPEFLTSLDLVELGLFISPNAACIARKKGYSPDYIMVGRKYFFLKSSVLEFIESRLCSGNVPKG